MLRNTKGRVTTNKEEMQLILEEFCSEDVPDITTSEIDNGLRQLKGNRAPGDDGLVIEAIKAGGRCVLQALRRLFTECMLRGITPELWHYAVIIVLHKKDDMTDWTNYRPISLLSHVYKLFTKDKPLKVELGRPRGKNVRWAADKGDVESRPREEAYQNRGRAPAIWTDDLKRVEINWMQAEKDQRNWAMLREAHVQQWTG
ncbi:hypothetical protein HUJ05_008760 [Dendroctonus ponderosae]|nr:hypothetical protein HUJ05_008760 [Dendroctonus ponderosae]